MMSCDCQSKQLPVVTPSQLVRAKSRTRSVVNYGENPNNNESDDESQVFDGGDNVDDDCDWTPKDKRKRDQSDSTSMTKERKNKKGTLGKEKKRKKNPYLGGK
jgi:hypothetical protein